MLPLRPGKRIAVVAPASPFDTTALDAACAALEEAGHPVARGGNLLARQGYLAGSEAQRADDLLAAIRDPDISAIWCARGGYGSSRLLPWLPMDLLARHPKPLIGHSDVTFLHLALASRAGWVTFHGPNLAEMGTRTHCMPSVLKTLTGAASSSLGFSEAQVLRHGTATGVTVGCNLTCMAHLLGTPYFPKDERILLLVEDRGEALYRIDRLFSHLKLAGVLDRVRGLLIGQFTDCDNADRVCDVIMDHVRHHRFPVVRDMPFGHVADNRVIPIGVESRLDTHDHVFGPLSPVFSN